ncbi:MAG TPA: adenylate/guanylate cyclase domain-containing protein [Anaerolineae bacterium]|nr:adenylate/guanylate cyclase domain-containing protein [Anaerolineae bacterium]
MTDSLTTQLEQLQNAIAGLEAQRAVLGDAIVGPALAALRQQLAALEAQQAAPPSPAEERRIVTILFTDIVGSTALAEQLDPEDWREVVAAVHGMAGNVIQRHDGAVLQYLGDGLLALFGAQTASEHDPENAIRAALGIQSEIGNWKLETAPSNLQPPASSLQPLLSNLQLRVGIHTGLVVVGELGSEVKREFTATGDAMNLAARLQAAAPPGGILISHDTYRYVRGVFSVTPKPPLTVKGKTEPIQTYLVRRAKPRPFRTVTRGVAGVESRTVGRDAELQRLQAAYLDAFEHRKVVWAQLVGEPGVGKSRLLEDMNEWFDLRPETLRLLRARAYGGDVGQPFALIRRLWFDRFQIAEDAPLARAEAKWVEKFQELAGTQGTEGNLGTEAAHALGLLVGLPFNDSPHIGAMRSDPTQVKGRALVVSRELLQAIREQTPIDMLLEDLHWADASSWEYLTQVILECMEGTEGTQGMFILATARPEWQPPEALLQYAHYVQVDLAPLSDDATRELACELLQRVEGVPDEVVRMIAERSEGVPYFAEELVNWFVDRRIIDQSREPWRFVPARLKESLLPATLQHLLLTRLSALSDIERAALQRGAIFGRNFWQGGLEALGIHRCADVLSNLQPRGLVDVQPESAFEGESEWSFHHALLRDVTYESVLKRERAALHKAAAEWLEEKAQQAGRLEEFAGLLGDHAERAGETSAAAEWYTRAGERAKAQGAPREARAHFDRALELFTPDERERRWRALLGREEALDLLGEREAQRRDLEALLELAWQMEDNNRLAWAYYRQAIYTFGMGDYRMSVQAEGEALTAAQRAGNAVLEVLTLAHKALTQTRLLDMNAARATAEEALARAQTLGDEPTLARTLNHVALHYIDSGDIAKAAQLHTRHVEILHRLGHRDREAIGLSNLGFVYVLLGLYKLARAALKESLRLAEAIGYRGARAYALQNLGLAYFRSGDGRAARRVLERSLVDMTAIGDAYGRAESILYLAFTLEYSGDLSGAAQRFAEAKKIYCSTGSSGLATDALAGLARCALGQGQPDEAHQHVTDLWNYLNQHGTAGMEMPVWAYLTCADIFDALGEEEQSRAAIEAGYRELVARAHKISDPEWRRSFLENVPEHRAIVELGERLVTDG